MSSAYVRDTIKDFLDDNSLEDIVDLSSQYAELSDVLSEAGVGSRDPWVGIDFIGDDEVPITVGSSNVHGKFREVGAIYIHVVDVAKLGVSDNILTRAETLRSLFRGQKIGRIFIESVTPVNFGLGASLRFEDGWVSGSFILGYQSDTDY